MDFQESVHTHYMLMDIHASVSVCVRVCEYGVKRNINHLLLSSIRQLSLTSDNVIIINLIEKLQKYTAKTNRNQTLTKTNKRTNERTIIQPSLRQ